MKVFAAAFAAAWFPLAAFAAAPATSFGLSSNQPIAVNADNFVTDLNSGQSTYTGNVIVTQGPVRLHADRLKVSAPGGKAQRMEVDGHVVVDSPNGQAAGDSGVYDVEQQLLRLTGNVVLTKDANVMRGSEIEVSMATGIARMKAAESTGRVQGLFVPQSSGAQVPATTPRNP